MHSFKKYFFVYKDLLKSFKKDLLFYKTIFNSLIIDNLVGIELMYYEALEDKSFI